MARQIVMQQPCSCRKSINYLGVLTHPWPRSHCLDLTLYLHSIQGVVIPLSRPLTTLLLAWGTWTQTQQLALTRAVENFANSGNQIGNVPHFGDGCRGGGLCLLERLTRKSIFSPTPPVDVVPLMQSKIQDLIITHEYSGDCELCRNFSFFDPFSLTRLLHRAVLPEHGAACPM